jgi:hypothetical protein
LLLFFLGFVLSFIAFLGVSEQGNLPGNSKTRKKCFYKKSMSQTFPKKIDQNFVVSFPSPLFFYLSRFRVFLSDGSSKTQQKAFYKKNGSKKNYKKIGKNPKPILFLCFFFMLGASRSGEFKNITKNNLKKV